MRRKTNTDEARQNRETNRTDQPAAGARVHLPDALVSEVFDAAERQGTDPQGFIRQAVATAVGADDADDVQVSRLPHGSASGVVALSRPATENARQAAEGQDMDMPEYVRAVVEGRADAVLNPDRQQQEGYIPAPDPAGVLTALTQGQIRDPARDAFMQMLASAQAGQQAR